MVLVDSSIWINFLNKGDHPSLCDLLNENLIVTNDVILFELIPHAKSKNVTEVIEALNALPKIELDIDWYGIIRLQTLNIRKGINKVGLPDLIIIQNVVQHKLTFWTLDNHFYLMKEHMNFQLY